MMCIMTGLGGVGKEGKEIVHPETKNLSLFTNRSNQFSNFVCGTEKEIFFSGKMCLEIDIREDVERLPKIVSIC